MSAQFLRTAALALVMAGIATGCGESRTVDTGGTSTTPVEPPTTTVPASSTTIGLDPVDWDEIDAARFLVYGIDGIETDAGSVVWRPDPILGEAALARDHAGGFVWIDQAGLWWLPAGAPHPTLVATGIVGGLVEVVPTDSGPVARYGYGDPAYVSLITGEPSARPPGGRLGYAPTSNVSWTAGNGLMAVIEGPEVELDAEGQPRLIVSHARLVVREGDRTIFEMPAGSVYEPYARIHDFDGRQIILSRGPYEPALPDETFTFMDLACGPCATTFRAAATTASLVDTDVVWSDTEPDLQSRQLVAEPIASDDVSTLPDGVYLGFIELPSADEAGVAFDLAVWFSGEEANRAAGDDGEVDIPVPNDYYIRNRSDRVWRKAVSPSVVVTSVWYDATTAPDTSGVPVPYAEFVRIMQDADPGIHSNMRYDPWWITIEGDRIVRLDEQYIP